MRVKVLCSASYCTKKTAVNKTKQIGYHLKTARQHFDSESRLYDHLSILPVADFGITFNTVIFVLHNI